jgi:hypothetical protein
VPAASPEDRYQPLPGILELPGWLFRKLSRRGKLFTSLVIALFLAAVTVGLILLVPVITETKRENRARDRREAAAFRRERIAQLTREARPHRGALATPLTATVALSQLQARIAVDAAARVRSGELETRVKRVDCTALNRGDPLFVSCVAVTSDIPGGDVSRGGRVGYPFRAKVSLHDGRYAFCRQSGRPGEGSLGTGVHVALPAACGG